VLWSFNSHRPPLAPQAPSLKPRPA
jgi:hypothetical protein